MKIITSALITLIAAAAFATEPTAPAGHETAPGGTATHGTTTPGPKVATAPTKDECAKDATMQGCEKWNKKAPTKKAK